jgi:hypothetical protein
MYAVNSSNNVINFTYIYNSSFIGGNQVTNIPFKIPPGNYSAIDLAATIAFTFTYGSTVCHVTTLYNSQSNKFQFQLNGSDVTTAFTPPQNYQGTLNFLSFNITKGSPNCIAGLSGAALTSTQDASGNYNLYSDVCVDLGGTRAVFVKCMNIHTPGYDSRTKYSGSVLARVPVMQEPFGITFWKNDTNFKCACSLKNVSNLEIQITDEFGNLVDFNLVDWTLTLQLDIINASDESLTDFTPNVPFINNHM